MKVTVAYATPDQQVEILVDIDNSTTVSIAIRRSGVLEQFPEIDLANAQVGVFSKKVKLDDLLREGDRVEIYRPLTIDPKLARRLRVCHPERSEGSP